MGSPAASERTESIAKRAEVVSAVVSEVGRVIVGQDHLVRRMVMALLTGGHVLLEGVPGLAKSLAVETLAKAAGLSWRRIQFTPDLLPADIVGTPIYQPHSGRFETKKGPLFANLILADEVNRAPAKVHSALLEAMQEGQVSIGEETHRLPEPFHVLATQNPIEHEGTYDLPEAGLDRFLFKVIVGYPSPEDEETIVTTMARTAPRDSVNAVTSAAQLLDARKAIDEIHVEPRLVKYVLSLVRATREPGVHGLPEFARAVRCGASPRASIALVLASRANALLRGKPFAAPSDVKDVALDVLRHRVLLSYEAIADGLTSDALIAKILERVEIP